MKKILSLLSLFLILFLFCSLSLAAEQTATLTGPSTVRAGDTVTLTFSLQGSGILGASGSLSYDEAQLSLVKTEQKIASPWKVEFNGKNFLAYDDALSNPIQGKKALFSVTFRVKDLPANTKISVSYADLVVSDGTADANLSAATYSIAVAPPFSSENSLSALTVANATLSPSFQPSRTSYTATVPFSVSRLSLTAVAKDPKAKVTLSNPSLVAEATTEVKVTVTAENGAKKVYSIQVTRQKDPNYVPSSNNRLSSLTVKGYVLSPAFDPDRTEYLLWLPYETSSVSVSGAPADAKGSLRVEGGDALLAGQDNLIRVICIAEDGTERVYTILAKRAPAHGSTDSDSQTTTDPSVTDTVTDPPSTDTDTPTDTEASTDTDSDQTSSSTVTDSITDQPKPSSTDSSVIVLPSNDPCISRQAVILAALIGFAVGTTFATVIFLIRKKSSKTK